MHSKGSTIDSFSSLAAALVKINTESDQQYRLKWNVYGLKVTDIIDSIKSIASQSKFILNALEELPQVDILNWNQLSAFIVPDVQDESFNFIALCTIWLGIPTLVSSESSIGKLLSNLLCPAKARCIVPLTGISSHDTSLWEKKINNDMLNDDARRWAKELSQYVRNNSKLWNLDLTVRHKQLTIDVDPIKKVEDWKTSEVDNGTEVSSAYRIFVSHIINFMLDFCISVLLQCLCFSP